MSEVIETNLEKLTSMNHRVINLGLKPSGQLHLGTAMTILNGMIAMASDDKAVLNISVMDRDFDFQRGRNFISFEAKPDWDGCHRYMKDHTRAEVHQVVNEIGAYLGVYPGRVKVSIFSEDANNKLFQEYFQFLFGSEDGRHLLRSTVSPSRGAVSLVSPICGSCDYSSNKAAKLVDAGKLLLETKCYNDRCEVDTYRVQLSIPEVNLFYLVDPIRDILPDDDDVTTHIFGGDYGLPYGENKNPKAERIFDLLSELSTSPSIYVGPILRVQGAKLGKSRHNRSTVAVTRQKFPNWVERLHTMLNDNPQEKVIELTEMTKYFS